ncbi:LTA synthase family protein [Georgenia sp. 311]|uniref:LTA synthase family protein n=1 Tax=Georgenia sp. 311 TaxID=2585134 RepID=UPI0011124992|nr:LTA synthase family protein [Georgenia sp. 311]TNC17086.1 LTA synthase family protein [Georgenia sp. 311]
MTTTDEDHPPSPGSRRLLLVARTVLLPLALTVLLAVALARGIELVHVQTEPWQEPAERWASLPGRLHLLGALTVWPFVALLLALTGSLWATALLSLAAGAVIAVADHEKMTMRGEPLFPSDIAYLANPGLLLDSAGISTPLAVGAVVLLLGALAAVALLSWRRRDRRSPTERRWRWATRTALGLAAVVGIVVVSGFNESDNPLREAYEDIPITWASWNQVQNYAENGFVAGALYNLPGEAMARPEGYDAERMAEVVATYEQVAAAANADRDPGALDDVNVVLVLAESFTDPTRLAGLEVAEDPIPFTRSLMERTPSGTMLSSGFGGGTANVEFEVLTGMAVAGFEPQMHAPYPMLIPHQESFPSVVHRLGGNHGTLTVHPYAAGFYRRETVYPRLGFERSIFRDGMTHQDRVDADMHISDAATYAEVLDQLDASQAPLLVNVVTMQNHSPYLGNHLDPVEVSGAFGDDAAEEVGQYLRGLRHSDDALADFLAELASREEETVVLLYGDHLPAMYPDEVRSANDDQTLRETPWLLWANTGLTGLDVPPVLGPNHLVTQLLTATGAPLTPFDALLTELAGEVAAEEAGIVLDGQGRQVDPEDLSPRAQELLEDYRLVQYDLSVGERYALDRLLEVPGD